MLTDEENIEDDWERTQSKLGGVAKYGLPIIWGGVCVCVCVCVCVEAGSNTLDHCDHQFRANFKAPVQLF